MGDVALTAHPHCRLTTALTPSIDGAAKELISMQFMVKWPNNGMAVIMDHGYHEWWSS
jgi:hypothetical protein